MDTKSKSIKSSRAYKALLAVLFIVCWGTLGIVTGFAGAYGYMYPNFGGIEALLIDNAADSNGVRQNASYAERVAAAVNEGEDEVRRYIADAEFYAKLTLKNGVVIENGVSIRNAIIAEGCVIRAGAKIGGDVENGERRISVIGKEKEISEGTVIEPGAIV